MARTRLRLGESLACMVYLHRWNCHKHLVFYSIALGFDVFLFLIFFLFFTDMQDSRMELRVGIGSGWIDIYRITHCQGTLLGLGSGSKVFAERRRPIDNVCSLLFFLFFFIFSRFVLWRKLQAKLSLRLDHRHLQHQCVEFCHSLILIVGNGYYLLL